MHPVIIRSSGIPASTEGSAALQRATTTSVSTPRCSTGCQTWRAARQRDGVGSLLLERTRSNKKPECRLPTKCLSARLHRPCALRRPWSSGSLPHLPLSIFFARPRCRRFRVRLTRPPLQRCLDHAQPQPSVFRPQLLRRPRALQHVTGRLLPWLQQGQLNAVCV